MSSYVNDEYEHRRNMVVAGVVFLLVVILLVLLLHILATRCLFNRILSPTPHRNITADANSYDHPKGIHPTASAMIPVFVYHGRHLECAICLSGFVEGEKCRRLPKCGHAFHVNCIDMWLISSSTHQYFTCPICRSPVFIDPQNKDINKSWKHQNHELSSIVVNDAAAAAANGYGTNTRATYSYVAEVAASTAVVGAD